MGSHQKHFECPGLPTVVFRWIKWFPDQQMTYQNAVDFCRNLGGQLFGDLTGESQQMSEMSEKFGRSFWLGATDKGHEGSWINLRGQDVTSLILWQNNFPDNSNGSDNYLAVVRMSQGQVVADDVPDTDDLKLPFACQMLFAELTPWKTTETLEVTSTESRLKQERACIRSQLGSSLDCVGPLQRTEVFYWVFESMSWAESKDYCASTFSAQLFDALDGTADQLTFLARHMQGRPYWLGITDEVTEGRWLDFQCQNLNGLIKWRDLQTAPNNRSQNFLCMLQSPWTSFDNCYSSGKSGFAVVFPVCYK